ncbi:hypothetical protein GH810_03590 [Acetobacterium paludosum]|uniref:Uncharacterized protein n=1 Tax=Acetobacterium paludosum TaxID=52693 RepID=A0A923KWM4_9FIRM|nr:Ig domain-containing protein [Acetobacterium paludosum]MBC3887391.1 hypothetical protein [Acetobacterium paludosum]
MKKISVSVFTIIMMLLMVLSSNVFANDASAMGVEYRAHIQDVGNYPTDGTWVQGSNQIGTPGLSRRIEGVSIKLTGEIPAGAKIVYNLHIQDYGWICDVNDPSTWQEGPNFAGTTHQSKRIEAIQIKLLDASNQQLAGYSVQYSGHVQDVGDVAMVADGSILGTVGASQRLECLSVGIVKVADFGSYYQALGAAEKIIQTKDDYTSDSVAALEKAVKDHPLSDSSTQAAVDAATKAITEAQAKLVKATTDVTAPEISELGVTFIAAVGADEETIGYTVTDADSYFDFDSIKNINNYTFAGVALPAGSTVTTDAATVEQKETKVTIHIPDSAVLKTVDGVFAISGIKDVDGNVNTAITQTGNIELIDDCQTPELSSAKVNLDGTITITFSKSIDYIYQEDFEISVSNNPIKGTITADGSDASKLVFTPGTLTDITKALPWAVITIKIGEDPSSWSFGRPSTGRPGSPEGPFEIWGGVEVIATR